MLLVKANWVILHRMSMEVKTIGSEDHLFVTGKQQTCRKWKNKKKGKCKRWNAKQAKFYTKNLTTGVKKNCSVNAGQIKLAYTCKLEDGCR